MTDHPIHTLPPEQLRGYALGLRNTAALLMRTTEQHMNLNDPRTASAALLTVEAWEREADLVEGFAARLESAPAPAAAAPPPSGSAFAERVAAWAGRFEGAAPRTVAHPISAIQICRDADAQCVASCTSQQDGRCGRDVEAERTDPTPTEAEAAQSGLADAAAESLAETARTDGRPSHVWTEERDALLAQLYPTLICQDALYRLLSAMPGEPIASVQAVRQRAAGRGIVRQGLPLPEGYEDQPVTDRCPRGKPGALQAAVPPADRPQRSDSPWTKERLALLAQLIPTCMHMDTVHELLSALPGLPIASPETVRVKASKIGIYRQGLPIPPEFLGAAASRSRSPQMAEKPATPPVVTAAPEMLAEDKAEALAGLRTGRFKGAKDIIEEYGCTQAEALALVDQHRARMGKAA